MISKFIPDFATQGLVDHDYTVLAMRRYAESSRQYWTKIIRKVKSQHTALIDPIVNFRQNQLKAYKDCRRLFDNTQTKYDNSLSRYLGLTKNKEPSALREDAFQLAEARKEYIKTRLALCVSISTTQSKLDNCLVKTFSESWILSSKDFMSADPATQRISIEMLRLRSWTKTMQKCANPLAKELEKAVSDMEQNVISHSEPSRDLNSYTVQASTISHFVPQTIEKTSGLDLKNGWLFVKSTSNKGVRQVWVRRWVFVKNGMFGWLNISPNKTFVQECDKIGVLLCHVTPVSTEDRRFVFEIKTKDTVLFMQAETLEDLRSWLQAFEDAKRLAIEGDKRSTISHAFQRFPPLISEFASTAGTSIDVELTHDGSNLDDDSNGDSITLGKSTSLFKSPEDPLLKSFLNQDESLLKTNQAATTAKSNILGPFGTSLASAPLLNSPMPTSMSPEAVLSTMFVQTYDIPTAVTANYWGSINWAAYQRGSNEDLTTNTLPSSSSSTSSLVQINNEKYPSYYPSVLRSQDIQLKAIYEGIPSDDLNNKVVLVFRCVFKPNPKQQLPARIFMTPKAVYIYSNFLGFVSSLMFPLSSLISVEAKSGLHQDTLFLISNTKTAACYSYLDSGRILQKRIQFLIDNLKSETPLKLKDIIKKLQSIGNELNDEDIADENDEANLDLVSSSLRETFVDENRPAADRRYVNLYMANYLNESHNRTKSDSNAVNTMEKDTKPTEIAERSKQDPLPDYSKLMAQLSKELVFDIPAKAMFHLMFGENSPVFKYSENGTLVRSNIEITPWRLVNSHMVEREISFNTSDSKKTLFDNNNDPIMYLQRIERMDNNWCYVVFQRHAIVKFPQGDNFYTTHRFVITKMTKSSCKLSIWSNIEWLKSSFFKNVTQPMVMNKLALDANAVLRECVVAREKLGPNGSTNTAIRMFGKLGTSVSAITKSLSAAKSLDLKDQLAKEHEEIIATQAVVVSNKSVLNKIWEVSFSISISIMEEIVIFFRQILKGLWVGFTTNKGLVLLTVLLALGNIGLLGISTKSFWMERHARNFAKDLGISLETPLYMRRSILLTDVDNLIQTGINYSAEIVNSVNITDGSSTPALCYNKFKDLALSPNIPEGSFDDIDSSLGGTAQSASRAIRDRIFELRSQIGAQRNWLMVELRTINKIESDLVMAEWRSWLYDEVARCSRVSRTVGKNSNETVMNEAIWDALVEYCESCRVELDSSIELDHVV